MEAAAALGLFLALMAVVGVGGFVLWLVALIEVARIPDHVYRLSGREKVTWVLIVALVGWIGALIWWLGPRQEVKAAADAIPAMPPAYASGPPAGWYPDPTGAAGQVWWDGTRWTGHRQ